MSSPAPVGTISEYRGRRARPAANRRVRTSKSLQKVVDDFVRSMRRRGLAQGTIDKRRGDLWAWLDFVDGA